MPGQDPEFWHPADVPRVGRRGRPKVNVRRLLEDYPAPNPQPTLCRLWQGAVDSDGYGLLTANNRPRVRQRAHRWVWEMVHGPIPAHLADKIVIRHLCDNPPCFRLDHLEPGTVADNVRDAQLRGHLGPARSMPPSVVVAIWERHTAGESYPRIAVDYPQWSLATIKRVKDYIDDARQVVRASGSDEDDERGGG
jgi:hypothetical protein